MSGRSMILKAYLTLTDFKVKYSFQYCEDGFLFWKGKTAAIILSCSDNRQINSENTLCMLQSKLPGMLPLLDQCSELPDDVALR